MGKTKHYASVTYSATFRVPLGKEKEFRNVIDELKKQYRQEYTLYKNEVQLQEQEKDVLQGIEDFKNRERDFNLKWNCETVLVTTQIPIHKYVSFKRELKDLLFQYSKENDH